MVSHAGEDLVGEGQRAEAVGAGDDRLRPIANRGDERGELALQGFLVGGGGALRLDVGSGRPVGQPVDLGLPGREVHRDVGPRREDTELADIFLL